MKKLMCAFAILAAAVISTAAVAGELKQDKKATAPAVSAAQMTDGEMDRVTAGEGLGVITAAATGNIGSPPFPWTPGLSNAAVHSGDNPGRGITTACASGGHCP